MSVTIQTHKREQDYVLQRSEEFSLFHFFCKIEQIERRSQGSRIRGISIDAGARCSDGSRLVLLPHDCRRVFASEHLNNNTPVHVIQALLGHSSSDTVMIYAKLYPSQLIEEYRKTVRSLYNAYYGDDGLKNPTAEEWAAFAASCNLRDMGTHLSHLPAGTLRSQT